MIVGSVSGSSTFTEDRQRHNILENTIQLPQDTRPTGVLPERKTADILVNSFFTNVRSCFIALVMAPSADRITDVGLC